MSYETTTYPPRTVNRAVGPVQARRGANYIALGAIRPQPWLETYENGRPLYSLSGYEPKDFLQTYTNGRPLESIGAATPKKALVIMALNTAMAKKCAGQSRGGMQRGRMNVNSLPAKRRGRTVRGLGDDGGDTSDSDFGLMNSDGTIGPSQVYDTAGYTPSGALDVPTTTSPVFGSPMSTIAGAPSVGLPNASTNPISSLLNSLFAPATSPYGSAYPYVTSGIGTGLGAPIYPGSSISIGGILLIGGLGILLMSAVGGRKR